MGSGEITLKKFVASVLLALLCLQAPVAPAETRSRTAQGQRRIVVTPTTDIEPIVGELIAQARRLKSEGKNVEIEAVYIHGQSRAPELAEILAHFQEEKIDVALMEVTPAHFDRIIERAENTEITDEELTRLVVQFSEASGRGWSEGEVQGEVARNNWKKLRRELAVRLKRMKARLFGLPKGTFFLKRNITTDEETLERKRGWRRIVKPIVEKNPETGKYEMNLTNAYDWANALWMGGASSVVYNWAATGFGTEVQTWNVMAASALFGAFEFLVTLYQKPFTAYSDRGIAVEVEPAEGSSRSNRSTLTYRPKLAYTYTLNVMIEVALAYTAAALNAMTLQISDAPFTIGYGIACATAAIPMYEALDALYKKADAARARGDFKKGKALDWGARAASFLYFSVIYVTLDHVFVGAGQDSPWAVVPFATLGGVGFFMQLWLRRESIASSWKAFRSRERTPSSLSSPRCQVLFQIR